MVVLMHRRRGGVTGMYHCDIPGQNEDTYKLYVGVYTPNTGGYFQDHHMQYLNIVHKSKSWHLIALYSSLSFQLKHYPLDVPIFHQVHCIQQLGILHM